MILLKNSSRTFEIPRLSRAQQRNQLDLLATLNRDHQKPRLDDPNLESRMQSFELGLSYADGSD